MPTLEVIKFRDVLRVASISLVPNVPVPTVSLKGADFRSVESVSINDSPSPEFIVMDKQTIYAQLPDGIRQVRTVAVLSSNFTTTEKASRVLFQVGTKTKTITGLLKLVQLFVKILLQSPGSDIFDKDLGGGLQDMIGQLTSTKRNDRLLAAISQAISQTESQIRRSQLDSPEIPLDERLLSATLLDIRMFQTLDEARARIQIDNVVGQRGEAAIEL
jgi:phage baseplate assembly protein W